MAYDSEVCGYALRCVVDDEECKRFEVFQQRSCRVERSFDPLTKDALSRIRDRPAWLIARNRTRFLRQLAGARNQNTIDVIEPNRTEPANLFLPITPRSLP